MFINIKGVLRNIAKLYEVFSHTEINHAFSSQPPLRKTLYTEETEALAKHVMGKN
jgi:hypothetical protein